MNTKYIEILEQFFIDKQQEEIDRLKMENDNLKMKTGVTSKPRIF